MKTIRVLTILLLAMLTVPDVLFVINALNDLDAEFALCENTNEEEQKEESEKDTKENIDDSEEYTLENKNDLGGLASQKINYTSDKLLFVGLAMDITTPPPELI